MAPELRNLMIYVIRMSQIEYMGGFPEARGLSDDVVRKLPARASNKDSSFHEVNRGVPRTNRNIVLSHDTFFEGFTSISTIS